MLKLVIASKDHELFTSLFKKNTELIQYYELCFAGKAVEPKHVKNADVLLGNPKLISKVIDNCPSLRWVQSTWAGNNALQAMSRRDYQLTGVKGVFGLQMVEYVLSYMLYFNRRIEDYNALKHKHKWSQLSCQTLAGKSVGIMGLGSIGKELAEHLQRFGMRVLGLSRSYKDSVNIEQFTFSELESFLSQNDYVISVLPEAESTVGLCNSEFFALMKPGSTFINVGRGSLIDSPKSLINALNKGRPKTAVLDVFEEEPLPPEHPYYDTPNLYISCHTAAISEPEKVFDIFAENALRLAKNQPLKYLHDFDKGY